MAELVTYRTTDHVSTITIDDGKVNVFSIEMLRALHEAFDRAERAPVAVACTGHAFPAGAFLLMAADTRVGADGPFKLGLNEVRIGLTLPWFAVVLARHRLTPAHFDHAAVTGAMLDPQTAREAGLLDAVVPPDELDAFALAVARDLTALDRRAHAATKLRVRGPVLEQLRHAIATELG
jgi:enoyl-CoA hydratase